MQTITTSPTKGFSIEALSTYRNGRLLAGFEKTLQGLSTQLSEREISINNELAILEGMVSLDKATPEIQAQIDRRIKNYIHAYTRLRNSMPPQRYYDALKDETHELRQDIMRDIVIANMELLGAKMEVAKQEAETGKTFDDADVAASLNEILNFPSVKGHPEKEQYWTGQHESHLGRMRIWALAQLLPDLLASRKLVRA